MTPHEFKDLNALVAEHVMGWKRGGQGDHTRPLHRPNLDCPGMVIHDYDGKGLHDCLVHPGRGRFKAVYFCGCENTAELPCYSSDIEAAWTVVQALAQKGSDVHIRATQEHVQVICDCRVVQAPTLPEAICRAALQAVTNHP